MLTANTPGAQRHRFEVKPLACRSMSSPASASPEFPFGRRQRRRSAARSARRRPGPGTGLGPSGSTPVTLLLSRSASIRTTIPATASPAQQEVRYPAAGQLRLGRRAGVARRPQRPHSCQPELGQHSLDAFRLLAEVGAEIVLRQVRIGLVVFSRTTFWSPMSCMATASTSAALSASDRSGGATAPRMVGLEVDVGLLQRWGIHCLAIRSGAARRRPHLLALAGPGTRRRRASNFTLPPRMAGGGRRRRRRR